MANSERATSSSWGNQPRYGEYEIVGAREKKPRLLGQGTFGKTFEAVRTDVVAGGTIKEYVAIKVLNPELLKSESRRFQFFQELAALTKFKHSNLIHYIRSGEENGEIFYAMELCRGGDLSKLVGRFGKLPEKAAALIGCQVAAGLREMHQRQRLVHRDIKPSNIMLVDELDKGIGLQHLAYAFESQENLCRIVDFGLVNFAADSPDAQQRFAGSPMYASPEQIREQPVDSRSDIYSLGMTLWYLVQGKGPLLDSHGRELKDMREAMGRHTLPQEHEADLPPGLSEEFRGVLAKMIAKRPEQRFKTAAEVQDALRHYLSAAVEEEEKRFAVFQSEELLEKNYELKEKLPKRSGFQTYLAQAQPQDEEGAEADTQLVTLTVVADVEGVSRGVPEIEAVARQLCEAAELSTQPSRPAALLQVKKVIWAADRLAYAEEYIPHVLLSDVLTARGKNKRPIPFSEAVSVLTPLAEGLDFMLQHGRRTVLLPCEEVWLSSGQMSAGEKDASLLTQPLPQWENLRVCFSSVCMAAGGGADFADGGSWAPQTMSGSMQMSDSELHPIPAFARLIYRILNGSEVAAAAQFTPNAYVPAVTLGPASNNLLRDLLCQQRPWTNVTSVLRDLCANEGVATHQNKLSASATIPRTHRSTAHPGASGSAAPSRGTVGSVPSGTAGGSAGGTTGTAAGSVGAGPAGSAGTTPGGTSRGDSVKLSGEEKVCEVIRPGVVCSPHDPQGRHQDVPADLWVPSERVRCQVTQKFFRLPRKLDPLLAQVVAPGLIQSPYAAADAQPQRVPWNEWIERGLIVCAESGKRIMLPTRLPLPQAAILPQASGVVISPYNGTTRVTIPPASWEPNAEIQCPATEQWFVLPAELPPLEALANAARPGVLATPYAADSTWAIPPERWVACALAECPVTHRPLTIPSTVESWPAEAQLVDASKRLVSNPFKPGESLQVPAIDWRSGATITLPEIGRAILLPTDLPALPGTLEGNRPGVARSPYTGDLVPIAPGDWKPNGVITCPTTHLGFTLPAELPEWIPTGSLEDLPLGRVRSPFDPYPEISVPPADWTDGKQLICPATGRTFRLPEGLPLLEGKVKSGRHGDVVSPFTTEAQKVSLDDWIPGKVLECKKSGRKFQLPGTLDEWLVDGFWVAGQPGRIRSPFQPPTEQDLTAEQWKPKQILTCPTTGRRFRAPITAEFPTLELEKAAFQYALAEPSSNEAEAAEALKSKHPKVSAAMVVAIWRRHELETLEKRQQAEQVAEFVPGELGFVRSPYGSRPKAEVPPLVWVETGATMHCPETGRRFRLPANLPNLMVRLVPGDLGKVISPFKPDEPFSLAPELWQPSQAIKCPSTDHPLQLPPTLPEWIPLGTIKEGQPGIAFSPYGRKGAVRVAGSDWEAGKPITCLETGHVFLLPPSLPPLTATEVHAVTGFVISPYARDHEVKVPKGKWNPGERITCTATKRVFLLPQDIPPWKKPPFPTKRVATLAAAAVVLLVAGLLFIPRKPATPGDPFAGPTSTPAPVSTPTPAETPGPVAVTPPTSTQIVFTGGVELEGWPGGKPLPDSLQVVYKDKGIPLVRKNNYYTATVPASATGSARLQIPGWQPVEFDLPGRDTKKKFSTHSTSLFSSSESRIDADADTDKQPAIADKKILSRQRVAFSASLIPQEGTDYDYLEAKWISRLGNEPAATPPETDPVKIPLAYGNFDPSKYALPTGKYDLTLKGENSEKLKVDPYLWKREITVSNENRSLGSLSLPPSLAGEYLGLLLSVKKASQDSLDGFFMAVTIGPRARTIKALVNPLSTPKGQVVSFQQIRPERDEIGTISSLRISDPTTIEFESPFHTFDFQWVIKVGVANGVPTKFMYGKLLGLKSDDIAQEKSRLEQVFQKKSDENRVPHFSVRELKRTSVEKFKRDYDEYSKEAAANAEKLLKTYSDINVPGASFYFGLHPKEEKTEAYISENGDWDLRKSN